MRLGRRALMAGALALGVAANFPAFAAPSPKDRAAVSAALVAGHGETIDRLKQWIALPTIAAEGRNVAEGADYMRRLALDAGFQSARIVKTDGVPGVFATLDAGAKDTLAVYFMYDVKQYDPAEWNSPPLEARIVDRPGEGKAIVGRGAVNQKGPETAFLAALHAFRKAGVKLPVNLVLVAEGEEEIASPNFHQIIADPEVQAALEAVGRDHHPFGLARVQGRRDDQSWRQGRGRAATDRQRREMGARTEAGYPFEPDGAGRKPGVASGPGAEYAGRRRTAIRPRSKAGSTM